MGLPSFAKRRSKGNGQDGSFKESRLLGSLFGVAGEPRGKVGLCIYLYTYFSYIHSDRQKHPKTRMALVTLNYKTGRGNSDRVKELRSSAGKSKNVMAPKVPCFNCFRYSDVQIQARKQEHISIYTPVHTGVQKSWFTCRAQGPPLRSPN